MSVFQLDDFDFTVPDALVAQTPLATRHDSRLLCLDANSQTLADDRFIQLPERLRQKFPTGPILIVANNSRVYPARVRIRRQTGARGEVFLTNLTPHITDRHASYDCLLRPLKKLSVGEILISDVDGTPLFYVAQLDPTPRVRLYEGASLDEILKKYGEMPLPPYIERDPVRLRNADHLAALDAERYQTIYANELGSQAAPTAGLHFTDEVVARLKHFEVEMDYVTLHVGLGTFQPVQSHDISAHAMHSEYYTIAKNVFKKMEMVKQQGGKIIFVGTTSLRAVESFYRQLKSGADAASLVDTVQNTNLFIWPRHADERFRPLVGDGLITNFHQPQSTLVMLTAALLGYRFWQQAYRFAIDAGYRFFSYGDASLILF